MKKALILIVILLMLFFIFCSFSPAALSSPRPEHVEGGILKGDVQSL